MALALVVATAQFMEMLNAAVISIALPAMAQDFGVTVYDLAVSIVIPASG